MAMQTNLDSAAPIDPNAAPLCLFDLDGTLTDPVPGLLACHRSALDLVGLDFDNLVEKTGTDVDELVRMPVAEAHRALGIPEANAADAERAYNERRPFAGLGDDLYPGIEELLTSLSAAGWRLGVATNQLEPMAEKMLSRLGMSDRFVSITGSDIQRTRTNKVQIVTHLLSQLDAAPKGITIIGDRSSDIDAAKTLQATSIGAAWGFGSIEELIGANADAIAVQPADVSELLLGEAASDETLPTDQ